MLQQTQVDRAILFYRLFLKRFPTISALAAAPLKDVVVAWQGLGYNRRAKMLHDSAKAARIYHGGRIPREYEKLIALPGVGEYTAKAVRVFACNEPEVMIETNIRAAFLHHFFKKRKQVSDRELHRYIDGALDRKHPREWYAALMDYGAHLKKTYPNPSRKSKHHTTQKPFKGSEREVRGAILRALSLNTSIKKLPFTQTRLRNTLSRLVSEGLVVIKRGVPQLPT